MTKILSEQLIGWIDIGPGAGVHGGSVVATGTPNEVATTKRA
jgi:excinuclease UvrABC ATPase subunit